MVAAQTITGRLYDYTDTLTFVDYEIVSVLDTNQKTSYTTSTSKDGMFTIKIDSTSQVIRIGNGVNNIFYSEIRIINIKNGRSFNSINLGTIPMIKCPSSIQVQYKGLSKKQVQKRQHQLLKDYNKKINGYKDLIIVQATREFVMTHQSEKTNNSTKLKLVYTIDFNDLIILKQ
ncbi:MAG: hypothetical protein CFE21_14795 [Bacteroidetes bacterium B1(2017)]|nr:MAG: hypothetical protein CFE21_14795 [Bacteroidetes bacterium B1(2017)]